MNLVDFIQKWSASTRTERAAAQEHFIDLCRLLGEPTPNEADPHGEFYAFEKGTTKTSGGDGFADVWLKDHFAWEYKGKHKDLKAAYQQLLQYREDLDNPPLLVVCDLDRFEVHTNFTGTAKRVYAFALADLPAGEPTPTCPLPPLDVLRRVFKNPASLRPEQTSAQVTERAAAEFATLAGRLQARGEPPEVAAHFLMRLLFCLFAEDAGLLPEHLFKRLVENLQRRPADFGRQLGELFAAMATGGGFGIWEIPHFNGGLFADNTVLPLAAEDLATLQRACVLDWSSVEPAVFGTLFERSLDPSKRAQLGAHYTSRADIELIVEPVLMAPLRRRWEEIQQQAQALIARGAGRTTLRGGGATAETNRLSALLTGFDNELAAMQVLDPACGSGNFLYVSLKKLLDLEKEVITFAASNGVGSFFPHVHPRQLHGIELNDYAYELAQVVIWIGYLQWLRDNGFGYDADPILTPLRTIQHMDAVLARDADGHPSEPPWPAADVIVGNPPFLGGNRIRQQLGDEYVDRLFVLYEGRVPAFSDLCCYWFERAREQIAKGRARRAGLLATQGIRGGANRRVLERIKESGDIFYAQADRPWILDGAAVRISMVGFDDGNEIHRLLNERKEGTSEEALAVVVPVEGINADLTSRMDLTCALRLEENTGICFMGPSPKAPFDLTADVANKMLAEPLNVNGRPNSDVVRPLASGIDLVQRPRNMWTIDFAMMALSAAEQYEAPFEYIKRVVYPVRIQGSRVKYAGDWWQYARPRPAMRAVLAGKSRFFATPEVAKHRIFVWLDARVLSNQQTLVYAREDDYFFGLLHSRAHELWALRMGTQLESRPRYTPTTCFETFPFPWPPGREPAEDADVRVAAIAAAARELVRLREGWLNPPGAAEAELKTRTLTNLYNQRPAWLAHIHTRLDAAVLYAYGWPHDLADEELLARLLALNAERAGAALTPPAPLSHTREA